MQDENTFAIVWSGCLQGLSGDSVLPQHRAFLQLTRPVALVEDTALLAAPNEFAKEVLESRLRGLVTAALSRALGREIGIAVMVENSSDRADTAANGDADATSGSAASRRCTFATSDSPERFGSGRPGERCAIRLAVDGESSGPASAPSPSETMPAPASSADAGEFPSPAGTQGHSGRPRPLDFRRHHRAIPDRLPGDPLTPNVIIRAQAVRVVSAGTLSRRVSTPSTSSIRSSSGRATGSRTPRR